MAIIGIDLGTSNSAAAVLRGGRPVIIPSAEGVSLGGKAFPSYVALTADGQMLLGEPARRQAAANPEGTTTAFKRRMGKRERVRLREREFSPEQLSAFLLQKIKRDAEAFLGEPVTQAVVTVPAYFDDNQRSATQDAAGIAGLEVVRLVNEPTAASLAYGLDRAGEELRIAVIDLGGGTLDVTIMEFGQGVFEVKATSGDTQLGGTDMNQVLFDALAQRFLQQSGIDLRQDRKAAARLLEAAEMAKIELSTSVTTHLSLPYIGVVGGEPRHLELDLGRAELERLVQPVIDRCRRPVEQALRDAGITAAQVDRVVFVGAPTRMPVVRAFFEQIFGRQAEQGVDPMECVACGAAIQAGILAGEVKDIVLVDVTPLTLGVETLGGVATPLIARNTPVPVRKTETFTTAADLQTSVTIHVFQGERAMAADNVALGEFNLDGIPPAPRGIPKIEVSFDIDASGILDVSARDVASGRSQSVRISGSTRLERGVKERMVQEAGQYADADRQRRESAEAFNECESLCYQAEKMVADFADKLTQEMKDKLEQARRQAREAIAAKDVAQVRDKSEKLRQLLKEAGTMVYVQGQPPGTGPYQEVRYGAPPGGSGGAAPGGPAGPSAAPGGTRVVDADYH